MAAVTICSDFGAQKIKSDTVSTVSSSICHEVMGPDAMILVFWMLNFKPTFSLFSYTFIKRLFSSSSLSDIRVVSSANLRLLIFLPAILIPACASSSPVFLMVYSAYKLNKEDDLESIYRNLIIISFYKINKIFCICFFYPLRILFRQNFYKFGCKIVFLFGFVLFSDLIWKAKYAKFEIMLKARIK